MYLLNGYNGSKIWNKITGGDVRSVDAIADITGDGIKDVVAGSQDGKVYCMNGATGTEIWNLSSAAANVFKVEVVGDITGDGFQEVVVGSGNDDGYTLGIQVLSGSNGEEVWEKTWNLRYYLINYDVAGIPDVTGDGKWNVLMSEDDLAKCYDGTNAVEFWSMPLPKDFWTGHRGWIESIPDISGDDWPDIINLRNDHRYSPYTSRILALSGPSGEEIWRREWALTDTTWLRDATHMPDITGDGRPEIIVSYGNDVHSLNGNTGSDVWSQSFTGNALSVASIPDISGDLIHDLIIGGEDNKIHVISGWNGSHLFDYPRVVPLERSVISQTLPETMFQTY